MKQMIKLNLNDEVKVKLTQEGMEYYCNKHNSIYKDMPELLEKYKFEIKDLYLKQDKEGYIKFQLHELFLAFGSECYVGSGISYFDRNEILIKST